jgi:putative component of membrane protein insertase Oxa1/YidC/SpoIIIJ protein YidD
MRSLALAAIRGYQRFLSPLKGFSCAFRAATGADSCSAYGYRVIERFGLRRGLGLLDRRLVLCGHVHRSVRPARTPMHQQVRHPLLHRQRGICEPSCDLPCDLSCDGIGHSGLLDCCSPSDLCDCSWDRSRKAKGGDRRHLDATAARVRQQRERKQAKAKGSAKTAD